MPDRDELTTLRRDQGLTNDDIADNHFPQFTSRQIGLFASMYDIKKGWKDEAYLRSQIEGGATPAELAEQWPVKESTVRSWMAEFDIDENPLPEAFEDAIEAIDTLVGTVDEHADDDELLSRYSDVREELVEDYDDWKSA